MKVSEVLERLLKLDKNLECEVLADGKKFQIKEVREGATHFIPADGEPEETKFVLITT